MTNNLLNQKKIEFIKNHAFKKLLDNFWWDENEDNFYCILFLDYAINLGYIIKYEVFLDIINIKNMEHIVTIVKKTSSGKISEVEKIVNKSMNNLVNDINKNDSKKNFLKMLYDEGLINNEDLFLEAL